MRSIFVGKGGSASPRKCHAGTAAFPRRRPKGRGPGNGGGAGDPAQDDIDEGEAGGGGSRDDDRGDPDDHQRPYDLGHFAVIKTGEDAEVPFLVGRIPARSVEKNA